VLSSRRRRSSARPPGEAFWTREALADES
jgi:hypothetical protein